MKIFLTNEEVLELSIEALDLVNPNSDKVHDIALKMDMVYNEELDMYEDVEHVSNRFLQHRLTGGGKSIYQNKMIVRKTHSLCINGGEKINGDECSKCSLLWGRACNTIYNLKKP